MKVASEVCSRRSSPSLVREEHRGPRDRVGSWVWLSGLADTSAVPVSISIAAAVYRCLLGVFVDLNPERSAASTVCTTSPLFPSLLACLCLAGVDANSRYCEQRIYLEYERQQHEELCGNQF